MVAITYLECRFDSPSREMFNLIEEFKLFLKINLLAVFVCTFSEKHLKNLNEILLKSFEFIEEFTSKLELESKYVSINKK